MTSVVTVCTTNQLHFARVLFRSLAEHHPELRCSVAVPDWDGVEPLEVAGATPLAPAELGIPDFPFLALRHGPLELCCAVKPFAVRHLLARPGVDRVLYLDADLLVLGPLAELLADEPGVSLVATAHLHRQFPEGEPSWEHPRFADVLEAGPLNAGLFALNGGADTDRFLATWCARAIADDGARDSFPGRFEQLAFNWSQALLDRVRVVRDPGYNVAFWNLHERPLRVVAAGGARRFEVAGVPLRAFHFTGYRRAEPWRLSVHESRHPVWLEPALGELLAEYARRLGAADAGAEACEARGWRFERLPCGLPIDARMRAAWRDNRAALRTELDPWTPAGERHYAGALFAPNPPAGDRLPILFRSIWREREDLRQAYPEAPLEPERFARWIAAHGIQEYPYAELHRRFAPAPAVVAPVVDPSAGRAARTRIASYLSRQPHLVRLWPFALLGERARELAPVLLRLLETGPEYGEQDVVDFVRAAEAAPWEGVEATLWLPAHAAALEPPPGAASRRALLAPFLARDPRFGAALDANLERLAQLWRDAPSPGAAPRPPGPLAESVLAALPDLRQPEPPAPPRPSTRRRLRGLRRGVNLFGWHRSPIGLGTMSRGMAAALGRTGIEVRPNLLTGMAMDRDLASAELAEHFDPGLELNLFVGCPHHHDNALTSNPWWRIEGRRNVVQLAWEQRDGNPLWRHVYQAYDQVWAISSFAARALTGALGREVAVVPCPLDFDRLPPPVGRAALGLDPTPFVVFYAFDAMSSIERKNPEAAIAAFTRAFTPAEPAELVIRIQNAGSPAHRSRLARLEAAVPAGARVRFWTAPATHEEVLLRIAECDVYLSLHRAEGLGYTCAEAMAYGRPVVASRYSGNLDFMDDGNSWLVDCREVEIAFAEGPFRPGGVWAEPDVVQAATLLRAIHDHPDATAERCARARHEVRERLSLATVGAIAARELDTLRRSP